MKLSEFKVGQTFWSGAGQWFIVDVGQNTVVAVNIGKDLIHHSEPSLDYAITHMEHVVFVWHDFDGCAGTLEEAKIQFS